MLGGLSLGGIYHIRGSPGGGAEELKLFGFVDLLELCLYMIIYVPIRLVIDLALVVFGNESARCDV